MDNMKDAPNIMDIASQEVTPQDQTNIENLNASREAALSQLTPAQLAQLAQQLKTKTKVREHKKVGRNDPCPCGSGKKYKKCCLESGKYEDLIDKK